MQGWPTLNIIWIAFLRHNIAEERKATEHKTDFNGIFLKAKKRVTLYITVLQYIKCLIIELLCTLLILLLQ